MMSDQSEADSEKFEAEEQSEADSVECEAEEQKSPRTIFAVNNVDALNAKLKTIELKLEWVEKLDTTVNVGVETSEQTSPTTEDDKAENDFNREMTFYNQALSAVSKAFKRLKKLNITTQRPTDYFAEMAKSDIHMNKVREKLLSKQTALERRDQVRAIREQKKQGKKIQHEILLERKAEKKKMLNALKKTKKGKMGADALLNEKPKGPNKSQKGKKFREFRDKKYGYGGKKKDSKWNTAESSAGGGQGNRYFNRDKKFGKAKRRRR